MCCDLLGCKKVSRLLKFSIRFRGNTHVGLISPYRPQALVPEFLLEEGWVQKRFRTTF